ncbi:hypothetical protein Droror1_Dr00019110 [Drosera rotundifolia]
MSAVKTLYDDNNEASAARAKQLEDQFAALKAFLQNPGVSSTYPQQFEDHASSLRVLKMPGVSSTFVKMVEERLAELELQRQNLGAIPTCIQQAEDQVAILNAIRRNFIGDSTIKTQQFYMHLSMLAVAAIFGTFLFFQKLLPLSTLLSANLVALHCTFLYCV